MPNRTTGARFLADRSGNIGLSAAIVSPLIIASLALGVDYGSLTLQQRELQQAADLAAISAAANLPAPEQRVAEYFRDNRLNIAVRSGDVLLTPDGPVPFNGVSAPRTMATVEKGRYTPDPSLPVEERFVATAISPDAVTVEINREAQLYFAAALIDPPLLHAKATAASGKEAAFSVGSRLASLNAGILNGLLTSLLGTSISLDLMDYQALVDGQIDLLKTFDLLGADLGLTAGTYQDVLDADIQLPALLKAMGRSKTGSSSTRLNSALDNIAKAVAKRSVNVDLDKVVNLGSFASHALGTASNLGVVVDAFSLISSSVALSNGKNQVAAELEVKIPGIASASVKLAVGEPPVGTPPAAVGEAGTIVRTAQTRVAIEIGTEKVAALGGLQLRVPFYLEVAHAEAKLVDITCPAGGRPTVRVLAVPGVAELAIGNVDTSAFANFGRASRVTEARLLDTPLLGVRALGYANATNLSASSLSFGPTDIANTRIKSVSTSQTLTSLQTSLLKNLDIRIDVGPLSLGTPKVLQAAVADTLSTLTKPLDAIVYNTLLALGVRIGEADVRVSFASCQRPVLVQ